jgi:hypothetical protein
MAGWLRQHYMGVLALFVALGGTAYAGAKIDSNDIAGNAIRSSHVAKNALTGQDVKKLKGGDVVDGSLSGADLLGDSITGAHIDESSLNTTRVVARFSGTPNLQLTDAPQPVEVSGSWTQGASELNQFFGLVVIRFPAGCLGNFRSAVLTFKRPDGGPPAAGNFGAAPVAPGAQTLTVPVAGFGDPASLEPGVDTPRTLEAEAVAGCDPGSTAFPVLESYTLTVIGHR